MHFLDSDILAAFLEGNIRVVGRAVSVPRHEIVPSMLTIDESLQGYLPTLQKFRTDGAKVQLAYGSLQRFLATISAFPTMIYSEAAENRYKAFSAKSRRIGAFDCRLIAHAVVENATIVTRNTKDFEKIREAESLGNLKIENWME